MYESFDAEKYLKAQEGPYGSSYESALSEIRNGQKQGHWIWYIFPQLAGLGRSSTSQYYAIRDLDEAKAYLNNKVLRERLIEISEALLSVDRDIRQIMWSPDDLKVRSCMTLFREADPSIDVFQSVSFVPSLPPAAENQAQAEHTFFTALKKSCIIIFINSYFELHVYFYVL